MIGFPAQPAWRRYPPLAVIAAAVLLAMFTLPSALNLPQANPGQVAEYAPISGKSSAPPRGNLAALGLGEGGQSNGGAGRPPAGPAASGASLPSHYDCVGNPPRQTEDPLSPPCVPFFTGDNGGATYQGVTGSEVTVLFRMDAQSGFFYTDTSSPDNEGPPTGYYDMDNPSDVSQFFEFRFLHDWEIYYNARYQTYKRRVHFWVYNYNEPQTQTTYTPSDSEAEAAENYKAKGPFAELENATFDGIGNQPIVYADYMAEHGVLNFGSYEFTSQQATRYPRMFWSYPPSLDSQAQEYASFVCQRIVRPGLVTFSGNGDTGKPRRYGLLLTDDPNASVTEQRQQLTVDYLKQDCDISFADTAYFHYATGNDTGPTSGWGTGNMASFRAAGVTTVIWPGGDEVEDMKAASNSRWYPEWLIEGDGYEDGLTGANQEPSDEVAHAWNTTPAPLIDNQYGVEEPGDTRGGSGDRPDHSRHRLRVQVLLRRHPPAVHGHPAGRSAPEAGVHGPGVPQHPARAVHESVHAVLLLRARRLHVCEGCGSRVLGPEREAEHTGGHDLTGCWRMWENGRRYLIGQWPAGDAAAGATSSDVCNLYDPGGATHLYQS